MYQVIQIAINNRHVATLKSSAQLYGKDSSDATKINEVYKLLWNSTYCVLKMLMLLPTIVVAIRGE